MKTITVDTVITVRAISAFSEKTSYLKQRRICDVTLITRAPRQLKCLIAPLCHLKKHRIIFYYIIIKENMYPFTNNKKS